MGYHLLRHGLKKKNLKRADRPRALCILFPKCACQIGAERPKQNIVLPFSGEGYKLLN